MKIKAFAVALALAAGIAPLTGAPAYPGCDPTNAATWAGSLSTTESLPGFEAVTGLYKVPTNPTSIVAMFHGYGNDSRSWACHILDAAAHGAIAFALDYRGTAGPFRATRGWYVSEGADDSIALTKYFLEAYPSATKTVSFGISMGANASGLAVSRHAQRPGGGALFDTWFNIEGVANLAEEYALANAVAPVNTTGAQAVADINAECDSAYGGDLTACLTDLTLVGHAPDMSDLKGVYMVHGIDDGLVPHDQSRQMATALRGVGVPVELWTPLRRNDSENPATAGDEGGTTLTQNVADPIISGLTGDPYTRPLAGHGWEGSDTHIVIAKAFSLLRSVLDAGATAANAECVFDSEFDGACAAA